MAIRIIFVGKTNDNVVQKQIADYSERLKKYGKVTMDEIVIKKAIVNPMDSKKAESLALLQKFRPTDTIILLDEGGKQFGSVDFAVFIQKLLNHASGDLVFVIGGAYGFDRIMYDNAHHLLSLSKMTFTHQMVRLFFVEQLYRSFTIINNENYHH